MRLNLHFNLEIKGSLLFVGAEDGLQRLRAYPESPLLAPLYNVAFFADTSRPKWESSFGYVSRANSFVDSYWSIFLPLFFASLAVFAVLLSLLLRKVRKGQKHEKYLNSQKKMRLI